MNKKPPQQLSLNFEDCVLTSKLVTLTLPADTSSHLNSGKLASPAAQIDPSSPAVVSLCKFRAVQENRKAQGIYRSIIASISHIS